MNEESREIETPDIGIEDVADETEEQPVPSDEPAEEVVADEQSAQKPADTESELVDKTETADEQIETEPTESETGDGTVDEALEKDEDSGEPEAADDEPEPEDQAPDEPAEHDENGSHPCHACGNTVEAGQAFCPSCGAKQEPTATLTETLPPVPAEASEKLATPAREEKDGKTDDGNPESPKPPKELKIKFNKKFAIVAAIAAVAVVAGIAFIPDMVASPQDLLEQGKYEKAYNKASDDEKDDIFQGILDAGKYETAYKLAGDDSKMQLKALGCAIGEGDFAWAASNAPSEEVQKQVLVANVVASQIPDIQDMAKDGDSVRLTDGYYLYDESEGLNMEDSLVMKIKGNNSFGSAVQNYYVSVRKSGGTSYEYYNSVADLDDDKIYTYLDSSTEKLNKVFDNLTRDHIRNVLSDKDTVEMPDEFTDGVNKLIEQDKVGDVQLVSTGSLSRPSVTT